MEIPRCLSAKYKEDFAYPTIKDRIPVILTKVIDHVCRLRATVTQELGECGVEDVKFICGSLSELKSRIQTDKSLQVLCDGREDSPLWNQYLERRRQLEGHNPSWFKSPWLYTECYFYRKLMESIHLSTVMKDFDPFRTQKQQAYTLSVSAITRLGEYLDDVCHTLDSNHDDDQDLMEYLQQFMQISLWGNKCDLSISGGANNHQNTDPVSQLNQLQPNILCDDSHKVWSHLNTVRVNTQSGRQIDIVLDNAGFELFADLCFAEFLLCVGLADTIRFHGKDMPWFVSDVTNEDFHWTLNKLSDIKSSPKLHRLGETWKGRFEDGSWIFCSHPFWTLPHDFTEMKSLYPALYTDLSSSSLIFMKGDLNYRKLTGDLKWEVNTLFDGALRGFHPAPLCALRCLKCDLAVGLDQGVAQKTSLIDSTWMINGNWAVIQMSSVKS